MVYTKEFLVDAFLWRYANVLLARTSQQLDDFVNMTNTFYDKVGKNAFRVACALDASEIKKFRLATGS